MNLFIEPLYALFSRPFYRLVHKNSLGRGFLYLFYVTTVVSILLMTTLLARALPDMNKFVEWTKAEMPPLVYNPTSGLRMNAQSPYTMFHPDSGPIIVFDMESENPSLDNYPDTRILVTAQKIFALNRPGQIRVFDLRELAANAEAPNQDFAITPEVVDKLYGTAKPWVIIISFAFFIPSFYIWKIVAGLFYSLLGLIFNQFRKEKLGYTKILSVSFYAMTPLILIQLIRGLIPALPAIPFSFLLGLILVSAYLYLGIVKSEEEGPQNPGIESSPPQSF